MTARFSCIIRFGVVVAVLNNRTHLLINAGGHLLGVLRARHPVAPQKYLTLGTFQREGTQVRHAEAGLPFVGPCWSTCCRSLPAPVVTSASPKMMSSAARPPRAPGNASQQLSPRNQHLLFAGGKPGSKPWACPRGIRVTFCTGSWAFHQGANNGMAHFVVGNQPLALAVHQGSAFHTRNHPGQTAASTSDMVMALFAAASG